MELRVKHFNELTVCELYEILRAREEILVLEKGMTCRDIDGDDYNCLHIFFENGGKLAAYLRAQGLDDGRVKIGRVLTLTHGLGLGRALMSGAVSVIRERMEAKKVLVHAQCDAVPYYTKMGFIPISGEYVEEGVPHISMELTL